MGGGEPERPERITRMEFVAYCVQYTIAPGLALECDAVALAIKNRDRDALRLALESEF